VPTEQTAIMFAIVAFQATDLATVLKENTDEPGNLVENVCEEQEKRVWRAVAGLEIFCGDELLCPGQIGSKTSGMYSFTL
jgi:hypothetical protein